MSLTIEMHNPQGQLLDELQRPGITQASVAITYAFLMAQEGDRADWRLVNAAIRKRWPSQSSLERVKQMAWKHIDYWRKREVEG